MQELVQRYIDSANKESQRIFYDVEPVDWTNGAFAPGSGGDPVDKAVFNINKKNFWDPDKHDVMKDLENWYRLSPAWQTAVNRVFGGLTFLDTVQSLVGVPNIIPHSVTPHEPHVYNGFNFFESVHAQSYSRINQALLTAEQIFEAREWSRTHPTLSKKIALFEDVYRCGDPVLIRIASVFFESFMFWTSFFLPLYMDTIKDKRLQVTATIIKLIMRDEGIHGYYIGYKAQKQMEEIAKFSGKDYDKVLQDLKDFYYDKALDLFGRLYELEFQYTEDLYGDVGLVEDVRHFLNYNANKAFQNLGWKDPLFSRDVATPNENVMALMKGNTTDDIFAGEMSTYKVLPHGDEEDSRWNVVRKLIDEQHAYTAKRGTPRFTNK